MKKETTQFERKSHFNNHRDSYVDDRGNYVYTQWVERDNGKWEREVVATIPFTEETCDSIIFLDTDDHDFDLYERYEEENVDYGFRNKRQKVKKQDDDMEFNADPIEEIPDPTSIIFDEEPVVEDPMKEKIAEFVRTKLTEEQQNLFFAHLGEGRFLEDIRREEEVATGKKATKQAFHNRWNRILVKVCKHLGVDKPKQEHTKNKNQ